MLPHMSLTTTDKPGFSTGTVGLPHGFSVSATPSSALYYIAFQTKKKSLFNLLTKF